MKEIKKKDEVERFLKQFLPKLDIWGIIYIDREKNDAALRAMGITPNARETVIRSRYSERMPTTKKYTSR